MNDEEYKKKVENLKQTIRALSSYKQAKRKLEEDGVSASVRYFEEAFLLYSDICDGDNVSLKSYENIIEILNLLGRHDEALFYANRRIEAQDKADWERWLYLKDKFGKE